jgi:type I restriction enzyme M protein
MSDLEVEEIGQSENEELTSLEEGTLLDYISGEPVKDTPKEQVRQRIARALFHEYGISVEDMVRDFKMRVDGRRKSIDIAIFEAGTEKTLENLRRVVVCDKEPKTSSRGAYKMRDHNQAEKEFGLLHAAMSQDQTENCRWGLWTNGLELFFFEKEVTRFDVKFLPRADWPMGDESLGSQAVHSTGRLRKADPEMLRVAFRRCHNFIHGNEGMPKDAAFWQFLYLIFAKMHDEQRESDVASRFWAGATEQFESNGRAAIRARVEPLFEEVKATYDDIFRGNEEITLSDRALAFMVSELAKYDFLRTDVDAKGAAYQEIVGTNLRGGRGQYFTPRGAINLMVEILDPRPTDRVLDPACGTGGFLIATVNHWLRLMSAHTSSKGEATDDFSDVSPKLQSAVTSGLFGADFDPFLVRATTMNLMMAAGARINVAHMDSLAFPLGHLPGVATAEQHFKLGTIDVLMTNPPFGSEIPITDPEILNAYADGLSSRWQRSDDGQWQRGDGVHNAVAPEVLFIQRAVEWLRPGGRMGIVLPNGILSNPGDEPIRQWILRHCWVLASVELPVEVFVAEADVNILTSLLFLKKKSEQEIREHDLGRVADYDVFMAVAERVGFDRKGKPIYVSNPDGTPRLQEIREEERVRIGGRSVVRVLHRMEPEIDNDLPRIAAEYKAFRATHPEPGT